MRHLLCALLLCCGGAAVDEPTDAPMQDVEQASGLPRAKNWCCDDTFDGKPMLRCGLSARPDDSTTCYCSGIVSANTEECRDDKPYTPGTLCTMSDEVCW